MPPGEVQLCAVGQEVPGFVPAVGFSEMLHRRAAKGLPLVCRKRKIFLDILNFKVLSPKQAIVALFRALKSVD